MFSYFSISVTDRQEPSKF